MTVIAGGGDWDSEISWSIGEYEGIAGEIEICLQDGCYPVYLFDSYGDGWNGASLSVINSSGEELLNTSFDSGSDFIDFLPLNDYSCISNDIGCTDSLASNFSIQAIEDDGSCIYPLECETGNSYILEMYDSYGDGWNDVLFELSDEMGLQHQFTLNDGFEGVQEFCVLDGCYTIAVDQGSYQYEVSWKLISSSNNEIIEGDAPYYGAIFVNSSCSIIYGCTDNEALNFEETATHDDGSCQYPIMGCMDANALNFNPNAQIDDSSCEYPIDCDNANLLSVDVSGGSWASEISWSVETFNGIAGESQICLNDGCFVLNLHDSYGDGWNGNYITILSQTGDTILHSTLYEGDYAHAVFGVNVNEVCTELIEGCIDSTATNYNIDASVDDGSCIYSPTCDGEEIVIYKLDSWGDGWNGVQMSLVSSTDTVYSTTLYEGVYDVEFVCIQAGCYDLVLSGGSYHEEVSWFIYDSENNELASGIAPYNQVLSINSDCSVEASHIIQFPEGYSLFSTNIQADDMSVESIFNPIVEHVMFIKNNSGEAYLPEWGYNGIGSIIVGMGYQIKTSAADSLELFGLFIEPESNPIPLSQGWNMIGYTRYEPVSAISVFEDLVEQNNLIIVKDYMGLVYLPDWNYNALGNLEYGKGYQLKTNFEDTLHYNANGHNYE